MVSSSRQIWLSRHLATALCNPLYLNHVIEATVLTENGGLNGPSYCIVGMFSSLARLTRRAYNPQPIDTHYRALQLAMQGVFHELGIAA